MIKFRIVLVSLCLGSGAFAGGTNSGDADVVQKCYDYIQKATRDLKPDTCKGVFGKFLEKRQETPCYNEKNDFSFQSIVQTFHAGFATGLNVEGASHVPACMALNPEQCEILAAGFGEEIAASYDHTMNANRVSAVGESDGNSKKMMLRGGMSLGLILKDYGQFVEDQRVLERKRSHKDSPPLCPSGQLQNRVVAAAFKYSPALATDVRKNEDGNFDNFIFAQMNPSTFDSREIGDLEADPNPVSARPVTGKGQPQPAGTPAK